MGYTDGFHSFKGLYIYGNYNLIPRLRFFLQSVSATS